MYRDLQLLDRVQCPHCWEVFPPDRIKWVSEHAELWGDERLPNGGSRRFLPTRFTIDGEALDSKNFPCHTLACPRCHLVVPRTMLEMEPLFMSIFGAPSSGKSYLLAAMTWQLRQVLSAQFAVSFSDADPTLNQILIGYEKTLFLNSHGDQWFEMESLIKKTDEQGEWYDQVSYGSQSVQYPKPFLFAAIPQEHHPNAARATKLGRVVCLYDNAGESFNPGADTTANPMTRHLAHSRVLYFVFDPTQDNRFRQAVTRIDRETYLPPADARLSRQEPTLQEAAARVRRYAKLRQTDKHDRPLIIVLTKFDIWSPLLERLMGEDVRGEPWRRVTSKAGTSDFCALDVERIERVSQTCRQILREHCPDIVAAAESFARNVVYVPASAIGWMSCVDGDTGKMTIRPADAQPYWAAVPFLYALNRWLPGVIPGLKRKGDAT